MGRIKTKWMKTTAERLIEKFPEKFGRTFEENKNSLKELDLISSKKMRNKIAGAIGKKLIKKKF